MSFWLHFYESPCEWQLLFINFNGPQITDCFWANLTGSVEAPARRRTRSVDKSPSCRQGKCTDDAIVNFYRQCQWQQHLNWKATKKMKIIDVMVRTRSSGNWHPKHSSSLECFLLQSFPPSTTFHAAICPTHGQLYQVARKCLCSSYCTRASRRVFTLIRCVVRFDRIQMIWQRSSSDVFHCKFNGRSVGNAFIWLFFTTDDILPPS